MKGYRIAMKLINQTKIFKFIVPIIVFILLYAVSTIRNNNVRKDGIYSIVTLLNTVLLIEDKAQNMNLYIIRLYIKEVFLYHLTRVKTLQSEPVIL